MEFLDKPCFEDTLPLCLFCDLVGNHCGWSGRRTRSTNKMPLAFPAPLNQMIFFFPFK